MPQQLSEYVTGYNNGWRDASKEKNERYGEMAALAMQRGTEIARLAKLLQECEAARDLAIETLKGIL